MSNIKIKFTHNGKQRTGKFILRTSYGTVNIVHRGRVWSILEKDVLNMQDIINEKITGEL